MGTVIKRNLPCLDPSCGSSDARQLYDDNTSFCFSCQSFFKAQGNEEDNKYVSEHKESFSKQLSIGDVKEFAIRGFKERSVTKAISEFFGVRASYDSNGNIDTHYYPYDEEKAYKVRKVPTKDFQWVGKSSGLFGKEHFNAGGKRLIICEGEIDTLSIAQASQDKYGKIYPVVGLSSSAMASKSLLEAREWIRSFGEVVLCMDHDAAGDKARDEAIKIIGIDKVKIAKLCENDVNDVLTKHGGQTLLQNVWDAATYRPAGILTKEQLKEQMHALRDEPSIPYPECLAGVNTKLKGMRLGQIALYISGTGSGKSTIIREVILHLLNTTEEKIGIISLEETPGETARSMASMELRRNLANEEIPIEELDVGFDKVFGADRIIVLDHQGSISDASIVDQMEYMALMGCKYLFIDHITILVSEGASDLKGNEAIDKIMNDLLRLVKKHRVHIGLVSHLRKTQAGGVSFEEGRLASLDDIKGSGSIKQVSLDIIAFARNMSAEEEKVRNHIKMAVLKCRATGLTGPVQGAQYHFDTGRITAAVDESEDFTKL